MPCQQQHPTILQCTQQRRPSVVDLPVRRRGNRDGRCNGNQPDRGNGGPEGSGALAYIALDLGCQNEGLVRRGDGFMLLRRRMEC
jgi:hypothetical protein